ncbi:2OG-Fe(II) oxygenase family protein [Bowmanella denitrificans]|uniref:2OG-Fe(II) oxygenase family protein n=1 Tax=Bowmanella denitrificans TaxID=366582 RepID=A0ABN0XCA3_9ALTE
MQLQCDVSAARSDMDKLGRVRLPAVLTQQDLAALHQEIVQINNWNLVTRMQGRHLDLDANAMQMLPQAQLHEFQQRLAAEPGFTYLFENYPVYDKWHAGQLAATPQLARLFSSLNSDAFLDNMRELLRAPDIGFADAQLTCYRSGHFLKLHDDAIEGKARVAAFVLSLTDNWQESWGGMLEFYGQDGQVTERFSPELNCLSLFKVPIPHAVSRVQPGIPNSRISVTGWLRSGRDPGP